MLGMSKYDLKHQLELSVIGIITRPGINEDTRDFVEYLIDGIAETIAANNEAIKKEFENYTRRQM